MLPNNNLVRPLTALSLVLFMGLAVFAVYFGHAQEVSTLFGFGLGMFSDVLVLIVLYAKLGQENPEKILRFEKWTTIIFGTLFFQLALVIVIISYLKLTRNEGPGSTLPGLQIGAICLIVISALYVYFSRVADASKSFTILSVANSTLNGAKFSATLLISSVVFYYFPTMWWLDSFAALFLAFQIGKEGRLLIMSSRRGDFERLVSK